MSHLLAVSVQTLPIEEGMAGLSMGEVTPDRVSAKIATSTPQHREHGVQASVGAVSSGP